jgi:hypothetical protein
MANELTQAPRKGATPRQARLIDWLKHPTGLPPSPAIVAENAMWSAREIMELSGLYESRRACLDDLNALRRTCVVRRYGNRWRYEGGIL